MIPFLKVIRDYEMKRENYLFASASFLYANYTDYKWCTRNYLLQHFIWVFTVCQSTALGVSSVKKVKEFKG